MFPTSLKTSNGRTIFVSAETVAHLAAHQDVAAVIEEAARLLEPDGGFLATDVDLGRPIGLSGCVPASRLGLDDKATFATRVNRPRPSRVAVGAEKVPTSRVAFIAAPQKGGSYKLITAWVGTLAPKEPGDAEPGEEFETSFDFWATHALVWESETCGDVIETTWREVLGL